MEALAVPAFWVCAGAVVAGAFIQGTGGLGFAMFAAPVAALLYPELVPGPMLLLGGTVSLLAALREPASIDYRFAGIAVAGRVAGSVVAGLVIGLAPKSAFAVAFALLILVAVALSLAVPRLRATPLTLSVAGFGSGLMGTITSVGAPPMGLVLQNESPARVRATIGAFIAVGAIVSIVVLAWAGRFPGRDPAAAHGHRLRPVDTARGAHRWPDGATDRSRRVGRVRPHPARAEPEGSLIR